uniref:60S ribosomal protein L7 n=1 Tax=Panagrellus redivivus TaxID=6233 RepID=A0A7E4W2R9_PANRE
MARRSVSEYNGVTRQARRQHVRDKHMQKPSQAAHYVVVVARLSEERAKRLGRGAAQAKRTQSKGVKKRELSPRVLSIFDQHEPTVIKLAVLVPNLMAHKPERYGLVRESRSEGRKD